MLVYWIFNLVVISSNQQQLIFYLQSENEALQKGDVIRKIDDYDTRDVRHVDAQNLLQNSEIIKLVVERSEPSRAATSRFTDTTYITASPSPSPTIFKSVTGNKAAVTSLSERNIISLLLLRIFNWQCRNDIERTAVICRIRYATIKGTVY